MKEIMLMDYNVQNVQPIQLNVCHQHNQSYVIIHLYIINKIQIV